MPHAGILREWLERLGVLYRRTADPWPGAEWLTSLRIRILCYLVGRYGDDPARFHSSAAPPREGPIPDLPTYCIVDEPADHPPRPARRLACRLRHIRDLNATPPPTLWRLAVRWWRARRGRNGDAPA